MRTVLVHCTFHVALAMCEVHVITIAFTVCTISQPAAQNFGSWVDRDRTTPTPRIRT